MLVFTLGQDFSNQFKKIKHPMAIALQKEQDTLLPQEPK